jgi:hypothetical protein
MICLQFKKIIMAFGIPHEGAARLARPMLYRQTNAYHLPNET